VERVNKNNGMARKIKKEKWKRIIIEKLEKRR
jgi:hypothetical protein